MKKKILYIIPFVIIITIASFSYKKFNEIEKVYQAKNPETLSFIQSLMN